MATAKDIIIKQIDSKTANEFVRRVHYSGKIVNNSQIHLGVFLDGRLEGAMQFGPSLDKRKIQGLVAGTLWHEFIELNRLAFTDVLPRNSESRALSVAMRLLKKNAPQLKWVISFADATQCGDGTIYRAARFILTGIKKNDQIWIAPDDGEKFTRIIATDTRRPEYYRLQEKAAGARESRTSLTDNRSKAQQAKANALCRGNATKGQNITHSASLRPGIGAIGSAARTGGASSMKAYKKAGFRPLDGYQIRYIYFLDPSYRARLTVPEIPYSEIERRGASMYRGQKRGRGETDSAAETNPQTGGASPTRPLIIASDAVEIATR